MKKLILTLLCLPLAVWGQTPPPAPASQAAVNAGTGTYTFVSPVTLAGYALQQATGGVSTATSTNIAAYQAKIATNDLSTTLINLSSNNLQLAGTYGRTNLMIGTNNSTTAVSNSIMIGVNYVVGLLAGDSMIKIGNGNGDVRSGAIAIGNGAGAGQTAVSIGYETDAFGTQAIGVGGSTLANGNGSIIVGAAVDDGSFADSIALGAFAETFSAPHWMLLGNTTTTNTFIRGRVTLNGAGITNVPVSALTTNGGVPGYVVTMQANGTVTWSNPPSGGAGSVTLTNTTQSAGKITGTSPGTIFGIGTNVSASTAFWIADTSGAGGYTNLIGYSRWENDSSAHLTFSNSYTYLSGSTPSMLGQSVYFDGGQNYFIVGDHSPLLFTGIAGDFNLHNGYMNSNYNTGGGTFGGPISAPTFNITDLNATNVNFRGPMNGNGNVFTNIGTLMSTNIQFYTNGNNTGTLLVSQTLYTNITADITLGGFAGVDKTANQWAKAFATNSTSSDHTVTLSSQVIGSTNTFVVGTVGSVVWVSNRSWVKIMFDLDPYVTNAAVQRYTR